MKKPTNYKDLDESGLHKVARDLLMWNCKQPVSNATHTKHYKDEIAPLHKHIDKLKSAWINKHNEVN